MYALSFLLSAASVIVELGKEKEGRGLHNAK